MVDVWTFEDDKPEPIKTQCEVPGYPNRDVDGRTMYENTHYPTEEQAWAKLEAMAAAREVNTAREYRRVKDRLTTLTTELAERAAFVVEVRERRAARSKP